MEQRLKLVKLPQSSHACATQACEYLDAAQGCNQTSSYWIKTGNMTLIDLSILLTPDKHHTAYTRPTTYTHYVHGSNRCTLHVPNMPVRCMTIATAPVYAYLNWN